MPGFRTGCIVLHALQFKPGSRVRCVKKKKNSEFQKRGCPAKPGVISFISYFILKVLHLFIHFLRLLKRSLLAWFTALLWNKEVRKLKLISLFRGSYAKVQRLWLWRADSNSSNCPITCAAPPRAAAFLCRAFLPPDNRPRAGLRSQLPQFFCRQPQGNAK